MISAEPRLYVLEELSSEGSVPPEDISESRELRMDYVYRACSELSEMGLVERSEPESDGDGSCDITERGERTLDFIEEHGENLAAGDDPSTRTSAI